MVLDSCQFWPLRPGSGSLLTICDTDSPPAYPVTANMNFPSDMVQSVLKSLNWATSQEDYIPGLISVHTRIRFTWLQLPSSCSRRSACGGNQIRPTKNSVKKAKSRPRHIRQYKRRAICWRVWSVSEYWLLSELYLLNASRTRLIVASQYDPSGIVDRLVPYLAGSASIVVHSPQSQASGLFR